MFGIVVVKLLAGCKGEASGSSGEAGSEGSLYGEEIRERKVTTGLVGISKPEGVKG